MVSGVGETGKRAAIYCRISEDRSGEGLGVDRQEQACRQIIDTNGWQLTDVYVDNDISGFTGKTRPAYRRLLEAIKEGHVQVLVAFAPDRITRRPAELEELINVLDAQRVRGGHQHLRTVHLATPTGRLVARQVGAVATFESELRSTRQRGKKLQLAQDGKYKGGPRPYGFEPDGITIRTAKPT